MTPEQIAAHNYAIDLKIAQLRSIIKAYDTYRSLIVKCITSINQVKEKMYSFRNFSYDGGYIDTMGHALPGITIDNYGQILNYGEDAITNLNYAKTYTDSVIDKKKLNIKQLEAQKIIII